MVGPARVAYRLNQSLPSQRNTRILLAAKEDVYDLGTPEGILGSFLVGSVGMFVDGMEHFVHYGMYKFDMYLIYWIEDISHHDYLARRIDSRIRFRREDTVLQLIVFESIVLLIANTLLLGLEPWSARALGVGNKSQ